MYKCMLRYFDEFVLKYNAQINTSDLNSGKILLDI